SKSRRAVPVQRNGVLRVSEGCTARLSKVRINLLQPAWHTCRCSALVELVKFLVYAILRGSKAISEGCTGRVGHAGRGERIANVAGQPTIVLVEVIKTVGHAGRVERITGVAGQSRRWINRRIDGWRPRTPGVEIIKSLSYPI